MPRKGSGIKKSEDSDKFGTKGVFDTTLLYC
jgi:hypothetical protein